MVPMGHKDVLIEKQIIISHITKEKVALKVLQVAGGCREVFLFVVLVWFWVFVFFFQSQEV